ncbi:failed axon connections homolog isoform X1 [Gordionus sp. m RMFG-2023]|uniref:failed axon connections homolog isoform X1 n=1 Tax=Gordionus sp. m RMFG-2023 TaxID=3053472 RepID=UPI0031FCF270
MEKHVGNINNYIPKHSFPPQIIFFLFSLFIFFIVVFIWRLIGRLLRYGQAKTLPKDVALIYGTPTDKFIPSPSPYVLKLETYLRMANIPYKIDSNFIKSTEGKVPWIQYNGLEIADSQGCIDYFNKKLEFDFNKQLSEREKSVALAFRILAENHLVWCLVMFRFIYCPIHHFLSQLHLTCCQRLAYYLLWPYYKCQVSKKITQNGIGYKTLPQVYAIASADLNALSTFLGNKSYFMGEQPSEVDASIFGIISQFLWTLPSDNLLKDKFQTDWTNLASYCVRMKKRFWPDWDERIKTGRLG